MLEESKLSPFFQISSQVEDEATPTDDDDEDWDDDDNDDTEDQDDLLIWTFICMGKSNMLHLNHQRSCNYDLSYEIKHHIQNFIKFCM